MKKIQHKKSFQFIYIPVILFDSVYRKNGNYCSKVFLEKLINNFLYRNIRICGFWSFGSSSWDKRSFLSLRLESSVLRVGFFSFFEPRSSLLKCKIFFRGSIPWKVFRFPKNKKTFFWENVRNFFRVFVSWNRTGFFWQNITNFLTLELGFSF